MINNTINWPIKPITYIEIIVDAIIDLTIYSDIFNIEVFTKQFD